MGYGIWGDVCMLETYAYACPWGAGITETEYCTNIEGIPSSARFPG